MSLSQPTLATPVSLPPRAPAAARVVTRLVSALAHGSLDVQWPDGTSAHFGAPGQAPRAAIRLRNWNVCSAALRSGDIGFAESYIAGDWSTPDLSALIRLFIANREDVERVFYGSFWGALAYRFKRLLHRNSRRGSRKNVHAHYDLGNAFYRLWLDESMSYSSAWFAGAAIGEGDASDDACMEAGQRAKMRRALDEAGVGPGTRLLEIGCGWGALAHLAAGERGAQVTGVTLSTEQLEYARGRIERAGLRPRCDLRLADYRSIDDGPYDAVVSIEMFEAVGREYWGRYFATLARCLRPGGRACVQTITIRDDLFERYVRSTDFIQQYIFPGGLLPSVAAFETEAARAGLQVCAKLAFGPDYARTLRHWRARFLREAPRVREIGFDERFVRIWEFYLAYCEAAFDTGNTDVVQFTLRRP